MKVAVLYHAFLTSILCLSCSAQQKMKPGISPIFRNSSLNDGSNQHPVASPSDDKKKDIGPSFEVGEVDDREGSQLLCDEVGAFLKSVETTDYSQQIANFCGPDGPTDKFLAAFNSAYDGSGTPQVETLEFTTNEMYVSRLKIFFAIKTSFDFPVSIFVLDPHDNVKAGYRTKDSHMEGRIDSREMWPRDNNAVQTIRSTYDLKVAKGAGIFDKRQTEANIYLLSDTRKDVAVVTERLLFAEENPFWVDQRDILVAIAHEGATYLFGVNDLIVKNRFDPKRFKATMDDINTEAVRQIHSFIESKKPKA